MRFKKPLTSTPITSLSIAGAAQYLYYYLGAETSWYSRLLFLRQVQLRGTLTGEFTPLTKSKSS